jgi:hypothetical protein
LNALEPSAVNSLASMTDESCWLEVLYASASDKSLILN